MIASEVSPWAKTGGLADVVGALPAALGRLGHRTTTVLPKYRRVTIEGASSWTTRITLGAFAHDVTFHLKTIDETRRVVFVDVPALFDRDGFYADRGVEYPDNAERFGMLTVAALEFAEHDRDAWPVDVVHAHDWQAGLAGALLSTAPHRFPRLAHAARVLTIHNLAYQGLFDRDVVPKLGLPWSVFQLESGEFWGRFGFLKTGVAYSDIITTVSPTYAHETQQAEFGAGMEGVLAARASRYVGILNGIDTDVWNPATDPLVPAHFSSVDLAGKARCKRALLERFSLPCGDDVMERPLVGLVSRLVEQKGLDLIERASADLAELDATWVFVGQGEPRFEAFLTAFAAKHPARVGVLIGFDESVAHLVEAGADIFLMPSQFEPCGLNQMYSLRYGTVPVVRAVGGLDDTIQPYTARARRANGFKFREATADALVRTVRQAVRLYHNKAAWVPLMRRGMAADHSWETAAREYGKVYKRAQDLAAARTIIAGPF